MTTFNRELTAIWMEKAKREAQRQVDLMYPPDQKDIRERKLKEFTDMYFRQYAGYR